MILINMKKGTCGFPVPVESRMKIKERETIDNYQDLSREQKKKL